jgi:hypothetical protein
MGKTRNAYKVSVEKPERNHLQGSMRILDDNIKMYTSKTGWDGTVWIHLIQDTDKCWNLVNTASMSCIKCREFTLKWESHPETPDHEEHILDHTDENPGVSMRLIMAELRVMQTTICRVLHEQLLYLYNRIWIIIFWISTGLNGNT